MVSRKVGGEPAGEQAEEQVDAAILAAEACGKKFLVKSVPELCGEAKHLSTCLAEARKGHDCGVLLLSAGPTGVAACAEVAKGATKSAKAWVEAALAPVGGKCGGSDAKAQGKGSGTDAAAAEKAALAFIK